jgi:hypothetical protein
MSGGRKNVLANDIWSKTELRIYRTVKVANEGVFGVRNGEALDNFERVITKTFHFLAK